MRLRAAVSASCKAETDWQARLVAGIRASLAFVAANPAQAEALTIKARRHPGGEDAEQLVIAYFAELIAGTAPAKGRSPISTDRSIVEAIAMVVRGHLLEGTEDRLPDAAADLAYLALLPYLGLPESRRWSDSAVSGPLR